MKPSVLALMLVGCTLALACGNQGVGSANPTTASPAIQPTPIVTPSSSNPRAELSTLFGKLSAFQLSAFGYADEGADVCGRVNAIEQDLRGAAKSSNGELLHTAAVKLQEACRDVASAFAQVNMVEREDIRRRYLAERDAGIVSGPAELETERANRTWQTMIVPAHAAMSEACDSFKQAGGDCLIMALASLAD